MSNLLNKVTAKAEDLLHKHNTTNNSTNAGPHNSNAANKVDPRVDSDVDGRGTHTTAGTHTGTTGGLTGSTHTGTSHTGAPVVGHTTGSTNHGPHSSNLVNKADPRFDSDLDGRANHGTHTTGGLTGSTHAGTTGTHAGAGYGTTGATGLENPRSDNHGPHGSNLMNKLDPRVDSDRDGGRTAPGGGDPKYGAPGTVSNTHGPSTGTGLTGSSTTHGTTGAGYGTSHSTTTGATGLENPRSDNHGPHGSNVMNKLDPRVDSDRDGGRTAPGGGDPKYGAPGTVSNTHGTSGGYGATHTGTTAGIGSTTHGSTNAGPYNSNVLNKADPRVDSDLDGRAVHGATGTHTGTHTGTTGYGANTTTTAGSTNAGPHNSNLMNKLDPRVDSDLDGSRRV